MADSKVTALTADTTPGTDSLINTIDDPSGTPASRKSTIGQVIRSATMPAGSLIQAVDTVSGAMATGTTVMPYDDTIPQNSEGIEFITRAITPTNSNNKLYIEAVVHVANSATSQRMTAALFQDTTADALAVGSTVNITANTQVPIIVYHSMTAGTTSATTFKIRVGGNGAGTTTFNGEAGARKFGGITWSWLRVIEVQV